MVFFFVLYISDSPVFNAFDPCAGYLLYMMEIQQILQHDLVHVRYRCTGRQYFRQGLQYGDLPAVFRQVKRQFTAYKSASDDDRMVSGSDLTGKDALCRVHIMVSWQAEDSRSGTGGNDHCVVGIRF